MTEEPSIKPEPEEKPAPRTSLVPSKTAIFVCVGTAVVMWANMLRGAPLFDVLIPAGLIAGILGFDLTFRGWPK